MLADADIMATIAVKDLKAARKFYEEKIGLECVVTSRTALTFRSGKSRLVVYGSEFVGTNKATSATWAVPDAEPVAAELRSRGVAFERYDLPALTRKGDLHIAGSFKGAWLRDPDGNILHILSR